MFASRITLAHLSTSALITAIQNGDTEAAMALLAGLQR